MNAVPSPSLTHSAWRYGCLALVLLSVVCLVPQPPMSATLIPKQEPKQEPSESVAIRVTPQPPVTDKIPQEDNQLTLEQYTRCVARELELDETLAIAVLIQESDARNPMKLGPRGGRGPLQIRPIALEEVGLSRSEYALPVLVYGGLRYLKTMLSHFDNLETALAAYNMGPTRLKERGYRPYQITQRYVHQVLHRTGKIRSGHTPFYPVLDYSLSQYGLSSSVYPEIAPVQSCLVS